jgi:protein-disulfide isomerase
MGGARHPGASFSNARGALALLCALGSVACERSSQAGAHAGQIDLTSPGGPVWPAREREAEAPELSDADVERISVRLPHQRVPVVSAHNPSKGPAGAQVTLQVFSDFECPFCVRSAPTLAEVAERYRGQLRVVWRNYPLPSHERARPAARAALEAFAQGGSDKFWKLHDWLFSPQADLSDAGLGRGAAALALDAARVEQAAHSQRYDAQIDLDMAAGDAAGIEGTPAVFINDYYLMGARHENEYAVVVARALREASPPAPAP